METPLKFSFKVKDEEFEEMSVRDGFKPAPYLARAKWVLLTEPSKLHSNEWKEFVRGSYELVRDKLPKKTRLELGI